MKEKNNIKDAFNKSLKGFLSMFPMLLAILLLLGIFDVYITKDIYSHFLYQIIL